MGTWWICIGGLVGFILLMAVISLDSAIKKGRAKSKYTEFEMDDYNHPMTWKDKTNYE